MSLAPQLSTPAPGHITAVVHPQPLTAPPQQAVDTSVFVTIFVVICLFAAFLGFAYKWSTR